MQGMSSDPARPTRPSVTLVLPAYNEQARIGSALDELFGYLQRAGRAREGGLPASQMGPVEVLIVDDGSTDDTVFADSDLATPPDQLPLLTDALDSHDVALGSRVHPDGSDRRRSQPLHR